MNNEPFSADLCPLCSRPLRPEFRSTRPSGQQNRPVRVWFDRYHCDHCEAADPIRKQEWADIMNARHKP
ncbi:hypothetical protein [Streptomyces sp. NBC_00690]|uniref:hypothetical protein n=1 Tax=Streptomyces sp. NBC_00690 TaxID=2975808 RepID=UPI002E2D0726|nr:hypothetical protein [Streptomyces sp. NBC_00690]